MSKSIILFFSILISVNVFADQKVSFNQDLSINASSSKNFFADVGAGSLSIRGADVDQISVKAKIYSSDYDDVEELRDAFDKYMVFTLDKQGATMVLKAMTKKKWFSFSNPNISVDLDIIVPQSMNVEIDDGSGSMTVSNIDGKLLVDDGSGSMLIKNIGNDVEIDDGSGHIEISNVDGDLHIDDGSGNQLLKNIEGSIYIDDGSGVVDIDTVAGDVSIDDGSGSIEIKELAGGFHLIGDGSGSIHVNGKRWQED